MNTSPSSLSLALSLTRALSISLLLPRALPRSPSLPVSQSSLDCVFVHCMNQTYNFGTFALYFRFNAFSSSSNRLFLFASLFLYRSLLAHFSGHSMCPIVCVCVCNRNKSQRANERTQKKKKINAKTKNKKIRMRRLPFLCISMRTHTHKHTDRHTFCGVPFNRQSLNFSSIVVDLSSSHSDICAQAHSTQHHTHALAHK